MGSARTSQLIGELHRAFDGDPWHGPSVMSLLSNVTPAQAETRPAPEVHSIAEITAHLTAWVTEVTRRLSGHPAAEPEDGDWPAPCSGNDTGWAAKRLAMTAAMARLTEAVAGFPESRLDEMVDDTRDPALGTGVTYEQTVHGLVQHLAYHGGQIALLKKLAR